MNIGKYADPKAERTLVTVRVANRFFCGTLIRRDGDTATVLVDTPQGGVTAMTGPVVDDNDTPTADTDTDTDTDERQEAMDEFPETPAMDRLVSGDESGKRDRVVAIAVGDLDRNGRRVDAFMWRDARALLVDSVERCGGTVYAVTEGAGVGSDGVNAGEAERSLIVLAGNVRDVVRLRRYVAALLRDLDSTSAAFVMDGAHEPVFDSYDGSRDGVRPSYLSEV